MSLGGGDPAPPARPASLPMRGLGGDIRGLSAASPAHCAVMETRQVCGSPRAPLLLLLLLLLAPWGILTASGVALPPAGVLSPRTPRQARAGPATPASRRSLALADDAAFRERARLLAALERRHWLNSYMHRLLLLDAP
ncbi:tuberoinfundibular peptide of 39 residues [Heterocephalus glaber]|uniref:Tuberoinfundibular peptide of 39 residues n=1 Tax=Heterocephalus glaber TaxID=10181 RepID=A0AAX6Q722_HETGA|nr:tuberoinfundibular peptide of 39 residues [Heterocephalus glaber]